MVGPGTPRVKTIVRIGGVAISIAITGCFWRSYAPRVRTHADVMVAIARKAVDLVASGRFTAESMPELTYPLERADAFAREARRRAGTNAPPSLAAFEELIVRYRAFVDALDRARREQRGAAAAALAEPLRRVEEAAGAVNEALRREGSDRRRGASRSRQKPFRSARAARCARTSASAWRTLGGIVSVRAQPARTSSTLKSVPSSSHT
jgi:hypothetical protein